MCVCAGQQKREEEERIMNEEKRKKEAEREELRLRMVKREQEAEEKLKRMERQMLEERAMKSDSIEGSWRRNSPEEEEAKGNRAPQDVYRPPMRGRGTGGERNPDDQGRGWRDSRGDRGDNYDSGGRGRFQQGPRGYDDGPRRDEKHWRQRDGEDRDRWEGSQHGREPWQGSGRNENDRYSRPDYDGDRRDRGMSYNGCLKLS